MGYETYLIIGSESDYVSEKKKYFSAEVTIDLCKLGNSAIDNLPRINKTPEVFEWKFFAMCGDGNTPVLNDGYDIKLQPVPLSDVITAIKQDMLNTDYRRLKWALSTLEAIEKDSRPNEFSVLIYGH